MRSREIFLFLHGVLFFIYLIRPAFIIHNILMRVGAKLTAYTGCVMFAQNELRSFCIVMTVKVPDDYSGIICGIGVVGWF